MAERSYAMNMAADSALVIVWAGLLLNDTGAPFIHPKKSDRTVHVKGTYGGATVRIEGSCDVAASGQDWILLSDPQGNDLDFVAADKQIEAVQEAAYQIRPNVSGGDGTTAVTVTILFTGGK